MSHRPCTSAHHGTGTRDIGSGLIAALQTASLAEPRFRVLIKVDVSLHHPPKVGMHDHFYVEINLDGRVERTSPISMRHMPWTETMSFDGTHDAAIFTLKVFAHRDLHKDVYLGTIEGDLASFIGGSNGAQKDNAGCLLG
ncbi:hypothetical protein PAXRUDRAFT_156905 [Paxillus rubicundulus Ve08.2h10]|uniref:C2 domain-containing protein n=1 Tax=Paxillus rubicundulus Ve08.2h10 TaxID=930991 RepID=A0A0D0DAU1_9AGAM|nr:hypothetical protein PAXRUDRAFT_156905 [Paxillus rubicundulus Ve08.2h10]